MAGAVTIFSPHRDDAAFSLCLCLLRWSELRIAVTVANFFTESAYAPRLLSTTRSSVPSTRAREDRNALLRIHSGIRIRDLGFLDAPLRFNIPAESVCDTKVSSGQCDPSSEQLRSAILSNGKQASLLAPLGLGNHVDHLAVQSAALANCRASCLGFYEDLPYATWTSETEIAERVEQTAKRSGIALRPAIIRNERAVWRKRQLILRYQSQISGEDATRIARFALKYGGGERIWIPQHRRWQPLLSSYI